MCKHELKDLMGVAGGVICRKCGMRFDHIPKTENSENAPVQPEEEKTEEKPEEEKPKRGRKKKEDTDNG